MAIKIVINKFTKGRKGKTTASELTNSIHIGNVIINGVEAIKYEIESVETATPIDEINQLR